MKKRVWIRILFVPLFSLLLFISCSDSNNDPTGSEEFETIILSENAIIISNADWQKYFISQTVLDSTGMQKGTQSPLFGTLLKFDIDIQDVYDFVEGDILLSEVGEGFCETIFSIIEKADELWIETGFASLAEAIEQGHIQFSHKFTNVSKNNLKKGMIIQKPDGGLYVKMIDEELWRNGDFSINANGEFQIVPEIKGDLLFGYHSLKELTLEFVIIQSVELTLTSTFASVAYVPKNISLGSIEFGTYIVPAGGVPLTITPEIELQVGASLSCNSTLTTSIEEDLTYTRKISYVNSEWTDVSDTTLTTEFTKPILTANATARIFLMPQLNFKIYKSLAPYVNMKLFGELNASIQEDPWWSLYYGLEAGAGVSMEILDQALVDYEIGMHEIFKTKVAEASGGYDNPAILVSPQSIDCGSGRTDLINLETITIQNEGSGKLTWTVSSDEDWIEILTESGETTTETDQVMIKVKRENLSLGPHRGTVTIESNAGQRIIPVDVVVEISDLYIQLPNLTSAWTQGQQNVPIVWETANLGGDVNIFLLKGGENITTIASNTPNDGEYYLFDVPADIIPGTDYQVYMISTTVAGKSALGQEFRIKATEAATITVIKPNAQTVWTKEEPAGAVEWVSSGSMYSLVRINLFKGTAFAKEIANSTSNDGSYSGYKVPSDIPNGTDYKVQVHTLDLQVIGYSEPFTVQASSSGETTVTDVDGNVYQTVKIGNQWWMAENLKVTHYRNGNPIPMVTDNDEWENCSAGAYCVYDNDISHMETYGCLYNFFAVDDSRKIAPSGWHVPTDEEWKTLEIYLGMSQSEANNTGWRGTDQGKKLKSISDWPHGSGGGTNESGFTAIPAGSRFEGGNYTNKDLYADFWTSSPSEYDLAEAWCRFLDCDYDGIFRTSYFRKIRGVAVRCVKD